MTTQWGQFIFRIQHNYINPIDRQRARGLLLILWVLLAFWAIALMVTLLLAATTSTDLFASNPDAWVFGVGSIPVLVFVIYQLVQSGRLISASILFVIFLFFSSSGVTARLDQSQSTILFPALVVTALLLGRRGTIAALGVVFALVLAGSVSQAQLSTPSLQIPSDTALIDLILVFTMYVLVGFYMYIFGANTQLIVNDSLHEVEVFRRVSQFSVEISTDSTEEQVFIRLLNTLRNITGADFTRLFLVDDTGEIYRRVTVNLDRLEAFEASSNQFNPVGPLRQTIQTLEQSIVTTQDNSLRRSHLLPAAVFAVTIPLVHHDRLVGVIDLQTTREPLSDVYQHAAQLISYQAALAIVQMRNNRSVQDDLKQKETALLNLRNRLRETEGARPSTGQWGEYVSQRGGQTRGFDLGGKFGAITPAEQLSPEILDALQQGEPFVHTTEGVQQISVPIQRADEILGAMAFELPPDTVLTDRQIDLARSIAGRLAVALDNRRLFEQSRMQADRERKASEIANQLISLTNVDAVLNEAADAFNTALGAVGTQVHVQFPSSEDAPLLSTQNGGG